MHYINIILFVNSFCKFSFTIFLKMPVGRGLAPAASPTNSNELHSKL